jgi:signal transduction histidine kinase
MWLRLALNTLFALFIFSACSSPDRQAMDRLNTLSYAYHYRDLDSVEYYASAAKCTAEGMNNLAFVKMVRMDYKSAEDYLNKIPEMTDNQLELLVCYVQQMRLCQRRSRNKDYHDFRERAITCMKRIDEERDKLDERQQQRLRYAETEFAIVNSTYYYYVGLERQSVEALQQLNLHELRRDTAQYLNYLYNVGAGGIIIEGTPKQIYAEEVEYLHRCLSIAQRYNYLYFEAQAKEALAEHEDNIELAEEALELFKKYGDVYQIAGAYRTLASCYHALDDNEQALVYLSKALEDKRINQAPDLVASIREQLSVAYAAINDKQQSDYNRNIYIDLQEQTRQDRELESRAETLDKSARQLNWMMLAVLAAIILLLFLLWLFNHLNQRQRENNTLDDLLEQKNEDVAEARLRVVNNERRHLEQRAKVSLIMSITPLIDRMLYTVNHYSRDNSQLDYIRELTDNINQQNNLLTRWIQLRQGELSLHIESFQLQKLFDIIARGKTSFEMKGVDLQVEPVDAIVKADRVLTLFMLNTLADNARKFTEHGGRVNVSANVIDDYVEISVKDTGCGLSEEDLAHVFEHKISDNGPRSHGFGLMNCKGIIEKYRKMSQLFNVCMLSAESEEGRGSRFFFRLPKGIQRIILLLTILSPLTSYLLPLKAQTPIERAHIFADSAYFCNINGRYARTLQFSDSCYKYLNQQYKTLRPKSRLLMQPQGDNTQMPAEIQWYHDSVNINYQIILDIRNESAVAALSLHQWSLYNYNNKVYTQLFKEMSADNTLADYCRTMQQSQTNKRIAMILLIVLLLMIVPAYYMLYYRHRLNDRYKRERMQLDNIEMADDELRRSELEAAKLHVANNVLDNCLSALKHETMYYPDRIRQLVDKGDMNALGEVTQYYRQLYGILSEQAMRQVEQVRLHVHPIELYGQQVLGDENMLHYLFEIIKPDEVQAEVKDGQYVTFTLKAAFKSDIDRLLCRQIVRDHGEATHRRGCGVIVEENEITITLPRYNGKI